MIIDFFEYTNSQIACYESNVTQIYINMCFCYVANYFAWLDNTHPTPYTINIRLFLI